MFLRAHEAALLVAAAQLMVAAGRMMGTAGQLLVAAAQLMALVWWYMLQLLLSWWCSGKCLHNKDGPSGLDPAKPVSVSSLPVSAALYCALYAALYLLPPSPSLCCTLSVLHSVYAALCLCCTLAMLRSVSL